MNDILRNNQLNEHQKQNSQEPSYESSPGLRTFAITNPGIPPITDKRFQNTVQRKLQETDHEPQTVKDVPWQSMINNSPSQVTQRKEVNKTGLPVNLKTGIENLSGMSMDDVKVHSNSSKPKELNALAYAQGNDIHLGPGQEKHLAHEAWHVVQQRQGRVKPTMQMKEATVNDDAELEREADVMGGKLIQKKDAVPSEKEPTDRKITCNKGKSVKTGTSLKYNLIQLGDELWSGDKKLTYHWVVENDLGTQFMDQTSDVPVFDCMAVNPGNYKISVQVLNNGSAVAGMKYNYQQNVFMEKLNTELGGLSVGNFDFKFDGKKIDVSVKVKFEFEDSIAEADHAPFKTKFFNGVNSKWGSHGRVLEGTTDKGTKFDIPINISCTEVTDNSYHKVVEVTKDYRRPKVIDEINVYLGISENTIAHEFGHVLGLDDEYDGGWVENIMFWHDDGSNQTDENALMNSGTEMRDRYFMLYKGAVESTAAKGYSFKIK